VLVLGAWNYPIFTCFEPVVSAIAAGNCVVLKPSEKSVESSRVITEMMGTLNQRYFRGIEGDYRVGAKLTSMRFDLIAFTGGSEIGSLVAQAAAKNLVPVVLELGGINPCIVDVSATMNFAAMKITNG
jgi:aldehyde dehydrogenase (NAD+)